MKERIFSGYGLTKETAERLITMGPEMVDYFEDCCEAAFRMGILKNVSIAQLDRATPL